MPRFAFLVSPQTDPYVNLAVEQRLMETAPETEVILFLWRNARTVVIGAHQNPWTECAVERLLSDGGRLARRRTGGGAVYHDTGNLNFSFVVKNDLYDVNRQLCVIAAALRTFGVCAAVSGRNDLTVEDRKFSGNAFLHSRGVWLHHGTILLRTDTSVMEKYLTPSPDKLAKRGVASVRSRVANLTEWVPSLTPEILQPALLSAFQAEYGKAEALSFSEISADSHVAARAAEYASDAWLYADWRSMDAAPVRRHAVFPWGLCDLSAEVTPEGRVTRLTLATDSLDTEGIRALEAAFVGWRKGEPLPCVPCATEIAALF